jgi:recombination protein RecT
MALPRGVDLDKFLRVAITALQNNPDLLDSRKYDRNSLYASIMTAAQLGLLPDVQLGECYFVPRKGKVCLDPGYRGLIKLARQGDIGHVESELIYENDQVLYVLGDESRLTIDVNWRDRGQLVACYALAKYRDGSMCAREVMMKEDIDAIRAISQAASGPAWTNNYNIMARKTLIRRLSKWLPLTTEAQNAFVLSDLADEHGRAAHIIDGQVIAEAEEKPEPEKPEPRERKRQSRRTQLDDLPPPVQAPADRSPAAVTDSERPDLNVDPESGEIIGGDADLFGYDEDDERGGP